MTLPHEIPQQDRKLNEFIPPEFRGGIFARFAMKKMTDLKAILPTQWLDSPTNGMIPRGNAMLLVTASSKGKSTSLYHACAKAAATGVWSMFGTRAHDRPLKVVYVSAEDNEQTITRKAAYDGRADAFEQTQMALTSGNLMIISLSDARRIAGVPAKVFSSDGGLTVFGEALFDEIRDMRPDVVVIDTIRACSEQADLNIEAVSGTIAETLDYLAEDTGAAVIATTHFTKEGGVGKMKITPKTTPSTLISTVRGSSQLTDRIRHTVCIFEDVEGLYKGLPGVGEGDEPMIGAAQSNIVGFKHGKSVFPVIRSREHRVFITHAEGRMLIDVDASTRAWRNFQLLVRLQKIIFASALTGHPLTTTGAYSPEKLTDSVLRDFLPDGATPELVRAALDTLLAEGQIQLCKITKNGAPNRYDTPHGPYANACKDAPPPSKEGAASHLILEFSAKNENGIEEIFDKAIELNLVSDEARDIVVIDQEAEAATEARLDHVRFIESADDFPEMNAFELDRSPEANLPPAEPAPAAEPLKEEEEVGLMSF